MACEYIKVTDKNGIERLEDLSGNLIVNISPGDIIFVNEATSEVSTEIINENDLQITFADGRVLILENMLSLMGENVEGEDSGSLSDELMTKLQFSTSNGEGSETFSSASDIFNLLDATAAGDEVVEVLKDTTTTTFDNINSENKKSDFRERSDSRENAANERIDSREETNNPTVDNPSSDGNEEPITIVDAEYLTNRGIAIPTGVSVEAINTVLKDSNTSVDDISDVQVIINAINKLNDGAESNNSSLTSTDLETLGITGTNGLSESEVSAINEAINNESLDVSNKPGADTNTHLTQATSKLA